MSKYYGTYYCGHEGCEDITGPSKQRERIAEWRFSRLCPQCYKEKKEKEKEKENEEAKIAAEEMELPELEGTEKKVTWGNTIRVSKLKSAYETLDKVTEEKEAERDMRRFLAKRGIKDDPKEFIFNMLQYIEKNKTSAYYWIKIKNENLYDILEEFIKVYNDSRKEEEIPEEVKDEFMRMPEEVLHSGVTVISKENGKIIATYAKEDTFRSIVKKMHFTWNGSCWYRELTERTGSFEDRAAELGNTLLRNGFTIRIYNETALEKAVTGEFEKECRRWILDAEDDKVKLVWPYGNDEIYSNARRIPSSKYKDGAVYVKAEFYQDLEDFAEEYGFKFSKLAEEKIKSVKHKMEAAEKVTAGEKKETVNEDKLKKILEKSGAIIDDLKDE